MSFVPKKLYYKIREVCEIVGVEAHVLRFWETEFPALSPPKSKTGQRIYRPRDIEILLQIRKLLYEDGFTIAGARKRLSSRKTSAEDSDSASESSNVLHVEPKPAEKTDPGSERLHKVKTELENILTLLDRE
jgi:DNA-binding transcriptional MerR regulator